MKKNIRNLIILGALIIIVILIWGRALRKTPPPEQISEAPLAPAIVVEETQQEVTEEPAEEWRRSPFVLPREQEIDPPRKALELTLTGITWKEGKALALINDDIVKEGDMIGGKKVVKIERNRVILVEEKEKHILRLDK